MDYIIRNSHLFSPPSPNSLAREVQVARAPRPAPAVEVLAPVLRLDVEALGGGLLVDVVLVVAFDVRVDDGDHPAALLPEGLLRRAKRVE